MVEQQEPKHLVVLWSSNDMDVALNMVFMYTLNSKLREWWEEVTLIVWGPSANLLANDSNLHDQIQILKNAGVNLKACKACADRYGVASTLEGLGIEVIYMGEPLTNYLKDQNNRVITF